MIDLAELLATAREQASRPPKRTKPKSFLPEAAERHQYDWEHSYARECYLARFVLQVCTSCGAQHQSLMGVYEQRKHLRVSDRQSKRLSADAIALLDPSTPRQLHLDVEQVQACHSCIDRLGFPIASLPDLIHAKTSQS